MINKLIKYQETDAKLKAIEQEIGGSEERKKALSAKKFLETVESTLTTLDLRAKELTAVYESLLKTQASIDENAKEFALALESAEDEGEITYIRKKADELLHKTNALENEINALSEEMKGIIVQYSQIKKKTQDMKAQYKEFGEKYNALKASREGEMNAIKAELNAIEKEIDPALMNLYKAKRKDKMFPIMYAASGKTCGHCLMELPMSEVNKLNGGGVIECDNCRCLIYKG